MSVHAEEVIQESNIARRTLDNIYAVAKVPSRRYRNSESRVPSTFYLW